MQEDGIEGFAYLCEALHETNTPTALSVLDPATGKFLEHRQLQRDPRYKTTWDNSYANELGQLCQGIREDQIRAPNKWPVLILFSSLTSTTSRPTRKSKSAIPR